MIKPGNPRVRAGQIAQGLRQISLIALALWLPRLKVGLEVIGWWEQLQYLGYLLGFSWLTGLGQAYLVKLRDLDKNQADHFSARVITVIGGISFAILIIGWLASTPLLLALTGDPTLPGWPFYLCFLAAHWPGLLAEQILLARGRPARLIGYSVVTNTTLLLAVVIPLSLGYDFAAAMQWLIPVALLKLLLTYWFLKPHLRFSGPRQVSLRPWFLLGGPLILYSGLNAINFSFDAWFVNFWYDGDDDVFALFRYGTRELPLLAAATNGITQAVLPQLGTSAGLNQLRQSSLRLMHLYYPLAGLLLVTSHWWWTWVFTEQLAASLPLFQAFLLLGISRMLFPISLFTARGLEKQLLWIGLIEIFINAILSIILVQQLGLLGIVWATVITYLLDKLLAIVWLWRTKGIGFGEYCAWRWWLGYSIGLVGLYMML